ncbi:MAG: aconitate hydratase AcnA, partial [Acidobacteriota bacterium]|nr:aconitate hydratase AcnA [Acidobacteriota bacterium]
MTHHLFNSLQVFDAGHSREAQFYSLPQLEKEGVGNVSRLPVCLRIVLESLLRNFDGVTVEESDIRTLASWEPNSERTEEVPFIVARVLLQDFTGVPLLVDLAAMRAAVARMGRDPKIIEPLVPVDLVIDHSVQVDFWSGPDALERNMEMEFKRNRSRYQFLKWGTQAFQSFTVVPPGIGICHQVNLEYLAKGVLEKEGVFYPDTLVGTDSHTTMINGLGIVGWGVGGIEAEAGMLGQPVYFLTPDVIGVNMTGSLREGVTATDLVLRVTEMLRQAKVVGKFVEFHGEGAASLPAYDRATIGNMAPEYGATMGFFPVDEKTLDYFRSTGRSEEQIAAVRNYFTAQGMFGVPRAGECVYSQVIELNLAEIEPSVSGPKRPQDRIELANLKEQFLELLKKPIGENGYNKSADEMTERFPVNLRARSSRATRELPVIVGGGAQESDSAPGVIATETNGELGGTSEKDTSATTELEMMNNRPTPNRVSGVPDQLSQTTTLDESADLGHGDVVIAAITSCTNTSNPAVMLGAGLLAKKAVERGLEVSPTVKASLAPGSRVVTDYYEKTGLGKYLDQLGFHLVGYGCTTCIAAGTPVLQADGTSRLIEHLPEAGGATLFVPTADKRLGFATQTERMNQGVRDCISLSLQDGRTLVCTPDHEILCADGRWIRADELQLGRDRVVVGLEAPVDEPNADEAGYQLQAGDMIFRLNTPPERRRTLALARIVGHLLHDGSISVESQGRMTVGQAIDREMVLNDIELLTGKRPAANRYDERKWTIVLPRELTEAIIALPGVRTGRRIHQPAKLPDFVLDENCPAAVVREFLGGVFGADGWGPVLHRQGGREEAAILKPPGFSQSAKPEHVMQLREMMGQLLRLLQRCGVKTGHAK